MKTHGSRFVDELHIDDLDGLTLAEHASIHGDALSVDVYSLAEIEIALQSDGFACVRVHRHAGRHVRNGHIEPAMQIAVRIAHDTRSVESEHHVSWLQDFAFDIAETADIAQDIQATP